MYAGEAGSYKRGDKGFDDVLAYYGFRKDDESNDDFLTEHQPDPIKKGLLIANKPGSISTAFVIFAKWENDNKA